jgi:rhomboid protease GluP
MTQSRRATPLLTATNVLILINALVFAWELATGAMRNGLTLVQHGALYGPYVVDGQWWRIVSGAFLHAGWLHIAFNMFALYQVGTFLEVLLGAPRMLLAYTLSMIGAGLAVVWFNFDLPTVGASGAIYGIFGALVAIGLRLGKRGRGLVTQTLPIILINLVLTFSIPGFSAAGHIGGLLTGFVVGLFLIAMHQTPRAAPVLVMEPDGVIDEVAPPARLAPPYENVAYGHEPEHEELGSPERQFSEQQHDEAPEQDAGR